MKSDIMANKKQTIPGEGEQPEKSPQEKLGQRKKFLQTTMRKIGFALLFLFIGALITVLALYLPVVSELKAARNELDRLVPLETEYISQQDEFQTTANLADVYKILSNANLLQISLEENKTSRINQYIQYIEEDLKNLAVPKFSEIPDDLSVQFSKVKSNVQEDRLMSINELRVFINDLLLLIDNLE